MFTVYFTCIYGLATVINMHVVQMKHFFKIIYKFFKYIIEYIEEMFVMFEVISDLEVMTI